MGMPLEKHLETMAAFHQGVYPVSESRTLNLLQQAGFSKILRFYTGLWVGGWIATRARLQALLRYFLWASWASWKLNLKEMMFGVQRREADDGSTSSGWSSTWRRCYATFTPDGDAFLMVKYSTLQSPFVMFIFWGFGGRGALPDLSSHNFVASLNHEACHWI